MEKRADLFLQEISLDLPIYKRKWETYFKELGLPFNIDVLNDTIIKCYDTIDRKGLRDGLKESFNYLFKAFKMNSIRELQYARNKYKKEVEDINVVYETYLSKLKSADTKITSDLWQEFQIDYILRQVERYWDKKTFYLFKLKYVLHLDDNTIRKKSKNPAWKKDLRYIVKWLKANIDREDIKAQFNNLYPDIDLSLIGE